MVTQKSDAIKHAEQRQACSLAALTAETKAADLKQVIKFVEAEIKATIAGEIGEDEKPRYSNDAKRDAEFIRRAAQDARLRKYEAELSAAEVKTATKKIDAQYHADCVRILVGFAEAGKEVQ